MMVVFDSRQERDDSTSRLLRFFWRGGGIKWLSGDWNAARETHRFKSRPRSGVEGAGEGKNRDLKCACGSLFV